MPSVARRDGGEAGKAVRLRVAYGPAWAVLRAMLPRLLAELDSERKAKTPIRGLGDLLAVAAE